MIRLLIVDDSPLMRRLLGDLFTAEADFEVAFAGNGAQALQALAAFRPDVITLDVQMPLMDGLACLDRIMLERPTPVVMASAVTMEGATETLKAIELGAVDFIAKPAGAVSLRMDEFGPPLVAKVRAASQARLSSTHRLRERVRARAGLSAGDEARAARRPPASLGFAAARLSKVAPGRAGLVVVGASTGGPPALDALLAPLAADFPWPVVVAQHMPATFTAALARRLDGLTELSVSEVSGPTPLAAGCVYVGRGDADVIVSRRRGSAVVMSAPADPVFHWHPSVDRLTESALACFAAEQIVGVLLTGMGVDGAQAMRRLRQAGGHTIAEAEETAVVWGMPGELVRIGGASKVAPREQIAALLAAAVA
jgi:two-component system chemotaxis response regulator CheB